MGKRDLRQLRRGLQVLVMQLLNTIDHEQDEIEALLLDSPSLRGELDNAIGTIYLKAIRDACRKTELPKTRFTESCPFQIVDIWDASFFPE